MLLKTSRRTFLKGLTLSGVAGRALLQIV
ncbi:twin-arginine translocation signal domain-containing protein, partial [Enterobacter cloacae complex sp. S3]